MSKRTDRMWKAAERVTALPVMAETKGETPAQRAARALFSIGGGENHNWLYFLGNTFRTFATRDKAVSEMVDFSEDASKIIQTEAVDPSVRDARDAALEEAAELIKERAGRGLHTTADHIRMLKAVR